MVGYPTGSCQELSSMRVWFRQLLHYLRVLLGARVTAVYSSQIPTKTWNWEQRRLHKDVHSPLPVPENRNGNTYLAIQRSPFRPYYDDFQPLNVIVSSDLTMKSVIDLKLYSHCPGSQAAPWWLLLESLDDRGKDLGEFLDPCNSPQVLHLKSCEDTRRTLNCRLWKKEMASHSSEFIRKTCNKSLRSGWMNICL